jgi:hypothetical protein
MANTSAMNESKLLNIEGITLKQWHQRKEITIENVLQIVNTANYSLMKVGSNSFIITNNGIDYCIPKIIVNKLGLICGNYYTTTINLCLK